MGILLSMYNICLHLAHFTQPTYQLWIIRILFIIPIYAIISFISIRSSSLGLYLEILRDVYEAFVIYCFLVWILSVIGGEAACAVSIAQRMSMAHPFPLCLLPPLRLNASFLRMCKRLTLQFVLIKLVTAAISFALLIIGGRSLYSFWAWQLLMLTAYNVSYTLALYGLFLFYSSTKNEMRSVSPVKKFLAVKAIVFLTYWQALFIPIVFGTQNSEATNDVVLCFEMVFFAALHYRAFPWSEFRFESVRCDEIGYDYTHFAGLDAMDTVTAAEDTVPRIERKKEDVRDSEGVTVRAWCSALCRVLNVMDVCDDARVHFVTPIANKKLLMKQRSVDEEAEEEDVQDDIDVETHRRARVSSQRLKDTLLFDEQHTELATKKQRQQAYAKECKQHNIELITKPHVQTTSIET